MLEDLTIYLSNLPDRDNDELINKYLLIIKFI